jgi:homoserine kinase
VSVADLIEKSKPAVAVHYMPKPVYAEHTVSHSSCLEVIRILIHGVCNHLQKRLVSLLFRDETCLYYRTQSVPRSEQYTSVIKTNRLILMIG